MRATPYTSVDDDATTRSARRARRKRCANIWPRFARDVPGARVLNGVSVVIRQCCRPRTASIILING